MTKLDLEISEKKADERRAILSSNLLSAEQRSELHDALNMCNSLSDLRRFKLMRLAIMIVMS